MRALLKVWFQNRRAKFRRNERNLLSQRHQTAVLYPGDTGPISLDPASAAAAAAFQARMAACNGVAAAASYRSPADYWATTGAYAPYSPAFDPLAAGTYCARAVAGASASMPSCALNGGGSGQTGPPTRGYSHEQNALARMYQNETSW